MTWTAFAILAMFFVLSKIFNFIVETGKGVAVTQVAGSQARTQRITKYHTIVIFFKRFCGPRDVEFSSCSEPFLSFWFWTCTIFIQTDSIVPTAVWKELQKKYLNTLWKLVASITPCKHNLFSRGNLTHNDVIYFAEGPDRILHSGQSRL